MWPSLFAESVSRNSCLEWDAVSAWDPIGKMCPVPGANCGMQFPLAESPLNRKPGWPVFGYPGFWVVDMFDWLLAGLAALDQHDEGYHYERCSRCCCGGD